MNDDLISRQAVIDLISNFILEIHSEGGRDLNAHTNDVLRQILRNVKSDRVLPPVTPQEPKTIQEKQAESEKYEKAYDDGYKNGYAQARFDYEQESKTGHWIDDEFGCKCSCCGVHTHLDKFGRPMKFKYCSMCGARMAESEE